MLLLSLFRRDSGYTGYHAAENRAPAGTTCADCDKGQLDDTLAPIVLALCSICTKWLCTPHFTMHEAPAEFYNPPSRRAWWLRMARPRG